MCRKVITGRCLAKLRAGVLFCGIVLATARSQCQAATLQYSTYFGGQQFDDAYAVAGDSQGNAYVAGSSASTHTFPLLSPIQLEIGGLRDVYVAKFDPQGRLVFSTWLGGAGDDLPNAIALDSRGNILIVGQTHSTDFPVTDDAFQFDYAGGSAVGTGDGFLAKVSGDGTQLLYATYFGGSADDLVNGVAVDSEGSVVIVGTTESPDLPARNALQAKINGDGPDCFIAKFDSTLTNLVFSTFWGGGREDRDAKVAVDPAGLIYVSGQTLSTDFPVTSAAFQTNHVLEMNLESNWDAFVSKLIPDGSALVYSTYLGHTNSDAALAIAADATGAAYITGGIAARWPGAFPLGFQPEHGKGPVDAYVAKINADGSGLAWFTYLGGSGRDVGYGLTLDSANNVLVTGRTDSQDFPLTDPFQAKYGGGVWDAFVARISPDGQTLMYSSYLGGRGEEWGYNVAVDSAGAAVAVGLSSSIDFPVLNAFQNRHATNDPGSGFDGYITRITPAIQAPALRIARSGSSSLVTWPANFVGYSLEFTDNLTGLPTNWQPASGKPLVIGDQYMAVQPMNAPARLFRLRRE